MWFLYSERQKLGYKNNILCQLTALEPASETVKWDWTMLRDGSPTAESRNNSAHLYQPFNHHSTEISPSKWNVMQTCTL